MISHVKSGPIADIVFYQRAEEEMTIHCFCSRAFVEYVRLLLMRYYGMYFSPLMHENRS